MCFAYVLDMFYENKDTNQSTQHAFGSIMLEIGKSKMSFADRVMTMVSFISSFFQAQNSILYLSCRSLLNCDVCLA